MELQQAKKILAAHLEWMEVNGYENEFSKAINTVLDHIKVPEIKPDKIKIQCLECEKVFTVNSNGTRMICSGKDKSITKGGIKLKCLCGSDQLEFVVSL